MTYHETSGPVLACDECGAAVPATERDRMLHGDWHAGRDARVIDLTRTAVEELRRAG